MLTKEVKPWNIDLTLLNTLHRFINSKNGWVRSVFQFTGSIVYWPISLYMNGTSKVQSVWTWELSIYYSLASGQSSCAILMWFNWMPGKLYTNI